MDQNQAPNLKLKLITFFFTDKFLEEVTNLTNLNYDQKKRKSPRKHKMKWDPVM